MNASPHKNKMPSLLPWLVWGFSALFYAYEFFVQVSPGVMEKEMMRDFGISAAAFGSLATYYLLPYAAMQIPAGILLDRFGPRRLLTIATVVCALGCLLFSTAHIFGLIKLGRIAMGIGSAFAAIGCLNLAARWFPPRRFALLTGLLLTLGMAGAMAGSTVLGHFVDKFGWQDSMFSLFFVGAVLSSFIWLIVRDHPPTASAHEQHIEESVKGLPLWTGLKKITSKRQSWIIAVYGSLMFAPTLALADSWGVPYISVAYGLGKVAAGTIFSMLFVGWIIGSPFFGWLSDHIGRRKLPMIIASVGTFFIMLLILYLPVSSYVMGLLLFVFGFLSAGFLPSFSIIKEINPIAANATALGFMNMFNTLGGAIIAPLSGYFLDLLWEGRSVESIKVFTVANYQHALTILPILIAISIALLPFITETYCKPTKETLIT